jgi:hypothetical protein
MVMRESTTLEGGVIHPFSLQFLMECLEIISPTFGRVLIIYHLTKIVDIEVHLKELKGSYHKFPTLQSVGAFRMGYAFFGFLRRAIYDMSEPHANKIKMCVELDFQRLIRYMPLQLLQIREVRLEFSSFVKCHCNSQDSSEMSISSFEKCDCCCAF